MKTSVKILSILVGLLLSAQSHAGALTVEMSGFANDAGLARIIVMAGSDGYHGITPAYRVDSVAITDGVAIWHADDIDPGRYSVIAHHDKNANGDLDRPFLSLPLEPYGYSQGVWTSMGLPDWDAVSFSVADEPVRQQIQMRMNVFAALVQMLAIGAPFLVLILGGLALLRLRGLRSARTT